MLFERGSTSTKSPSLNFLFMLSHRIFLLKPLSHFLLCPHPLSFMRLQCISLMEKVGARLPRRFIPHRNTLLAREVLEEQLGTQKQIK